MRLKYLAINNDDPSISDFATIAPDDLIVDSAVPLDGVLQFAYVVGQSYKDSEGVVTDVPAVSCSPAGSSNSCSDTTCPYTVSKCKLVPISPKPVALTGPAIRATSSNIVADIQHLSDTTSPDETTQAALQVAMAASNEVFSDTVSLFWAVVTTGTKPKMMKNVPNYCGVKRVFNSTM
ncbi:hypothetical protein DYB28_002737 [Aphanomyces astaci]|uniref:Uncharacterized protein n=1 Tax=Aphanomyces astaci TaxID=112090 RepID=A0A9X8E2C7_APHAT|nr:hypothetical protein DYB28_002737 [Aphanomyces astaci]